MPIDLQALQGLPLADSGLSNAQVEAQRERFGDNRLFEDTSQSLWARFIEIAKDPMLIFLVLLAATYAFLGDYVEAAVLAIATIPLAGMDAFLHHRAKAALSGLQATLAASVWVRREGQVTNIPSHALVPGDLLKLDVGDVVLADGVLEEGSDVFVDESTLTGESWPVAKIAMDSTHMAQAVKDTAGIEAAHTVLSGTRVVRGQGWLRVVGTGKTTQYAEIIRLASQSTPQETPLQKMVHAWVRRLIVGALALCALLAALRLAQGHSWMDALLTAAGLAMAAIPEEFPLVLLFFTGLGVYRLSRLGVLVRKASSVENLGRLTYLCTDKTGTLTRGEVTLVDLEPAPDVQADELLAWAVLASGSPQSDPMDAAIHARASAAPHTKEGRIVQRYPFTEQRRRESVVLEGTEGYWMVTKGAVEEIWQHCQLSKEDRAHWQERVDGFAKQARRVLACARTLPQQSLPSDEAFLGYVFLGLLVFDDPPRPGVEAALAFCQQEGVRVLMLTGDYPETARAIALRVGLGGESPRVMTFPSSGVASSPSNDAWEAQELLKADVIARCSPEQKHRVIRTLQSLGHHCAVTGDGVNDVPALRAADVGIAMGQRGSQAAKDIAAMILSDDNFVTLVDAIKEGRRLFQTLSLSFRYLLLFHIPFVLTAAWIPAMGFPLIYLPIHLVWLELLIHPAAMLGFQSYKRTHYTRPSQALMDRPTLLGVVVMGLMVTGYLITYWVYAMGLGSSVETVRANVILFLVLWSSGLLLHLNHWKGRAAWAVASISIIFSLGLILWPDLGGYTHVARVSTRDALLQVIAAFGTLASLATLDFVGSRRSVRA